MTTINKLPTKAWRGSLLTKSLCCPEDLSSVPSTHTGQFTDTFNSSSKDHVVLFWHPQEPNICAPHKHTHKKILKMCHQHFIHKIIKKWGRNESNAHKYVHDKEETQSQLLYEHIYIFCLKTVIDIYNIMFLFIS